jgi:hypothetical protein
MGYSQHFSPIPYPLPPIPFVLTLFQTLLHSPKTQLFSFQAIPHSFAKTPGVGGGGVMAGEGGSAISNHKLFVFFTGHSPLLQRCYIFNIYERHF